MDLTRLRNPRLREDLEYLFGSSWTYTALTDTVDIVATTVAITGNLTVSGSITFGSTVVPEAYTYLGTLTVGLNDTGYDVIFYGATAGSYWMWDASGDEVIQVGALTMTGALAVTGTSALTGAVTIAGAVGITGATTMIGALTIGVNATGHDVIFYAETTGYKFFWDQNQDTNGGLTIIGTVIVGANDTGHDVKFYGATAGSYWLWDEDADGVVQVGSLTLTGAAAITGTVAIVGTLTVGVDDTGHDVKFYGAGSGYYWLWDENVDTNGGMVIVGTSKITGASTLIGALTVGVNDTGHDVKLFGATDGSYLLWDESDDRLEFVNAWIEMGTSGSPTSIVFDGKKVLGIYTTCASTNAGTSLEPVVVSTTMTGAGQVGGRSLFYMTTNVALGGWSNALKAQVVYGAAGRTAGLGSALVAEMTLSAGTTPGTYAPFEIELNMGAAGVCGAQTSLIYMAVNDAAATTFDTDGFLFAINGLTKGVGGLFHATTATAATHGLRISVGGVGYDILLKETGAS